MAREGNFDAVLRWGILLKLQVEGEITGSNTKQLVKAFDLTSKTSHDQFERALERLIKEKEIVRSGDSYRLAGG